MTEPHRPNRHRRREPAAEPPASWLVLVIACLAQFMVVLDATVVNVALPSIQRGLHFSAVEPAVGRQRLHAGVRRLPAARRARRRPARAQAAVHGRRAAVLGRLAAQRPRPDLGDADRRPRPAGPRRRAASPPPPWRSSPPRSPTPPSAPRRWACGARSRPAAAPSACCMGGVLTDLASWRWVFFVNVPVGVITIALALRYVAESRDRGRAPLVRPRRRRDRHRRSGRARLRDRQGAVLRLGLGHARSGCWPPPWRCWRVRRDRAPQQSPRWCA